MPRLSAEQLQQVLFAFTWWLQKLQAFNDLQLAGGATGATTRKWDGSQVLVTEIDQLAAVGSLDRLVVSS
jgi:hypothetical protein